MVVHIGVQPTCWGYLTLTMLTICTGLFDAKRGSDFLEVSYTKFYDHFKVSQEYCPYNHQSR